MAFLEDLAESAIKSGNCACVGLDLDYSAMPPEFRENWDFEACLEYYKSIFTGILEAKLIPAAFKPNQGFFIRYDKPLQGDFRGSRLLAATIGLIRDFFPGVPLILDFKRGDIATSSENYAVEGFLCWGADAVTVSGYMGEDSLKPFFAYCDKHSKGVYVLCRTSNPGSAAVQSLLVEPSQNKQLYYRLGEMVAEWASRHRGVGAVVGATQPNELERLAYLFSKGMVPMLIPGVGGQGGSAALALSLMRKSGYNPVYARINSSSQITHPWVKRGEAPPKNWLQECLGNLEKLINETRV